MRKHALITHVEPELANTIKKMADEDGRTASSFIRLVLKTYVDKRAGR